MALVTIPLRLSFIIPEGYIDHTVNNTRVHPDNNDDFPCRKESNIHDITEIVLSFNRIIMVEITICFSDLRRSLLTATIFVHN